MRRLFIFCCILACFLSCTDNFDNPIPVRPVYLELDLTFRDKELNAHLSYKIFTDKNTIGGKERTGYAGVLVTNSLDGYKAFDLACPNEVRMDAVVEIDNENNAVCKVCGSKYEVILNFGSGMCISGPSKHALRQYSTIKNNNSLIVRN